MLRTSLLVAILACCLVGSSYGLTQTQDDEPQASESQQDEGFRIGVAVDQVFLSVNARSVHGGFVSDLRQEDFEVYEDGAQQEIANFYSQEVPVHVVLLIDASGSTRYNQTEIRRAALKFAESLKPEDQVAIITFNDAPRLIMNWGSDIERIKLSLESIYAKGPTVLNDALYVTFDDLLADVEGKKAVILLTDGVDTGSMVSFEESRELALRSEAMVYVVSKLKEYWTGAIGARQQYVLRGMSVPAELSDDYIIQVRRDLQSLAETTGGKVLETEAFTNLTDIYSRVAEELKNQYYISYVPSNGRKDGTWREVEVKVKFRPDVVVSTRRGYYADGSSFAQ